MVNKIGMFALTLVISGFSLPLAAEHNDEHKLAELHGCTACHGLAPSMVDGKRQALPIGPSFEEIANRYFENSKPDKYQELYRIVKYGSSPYSSKWKGEISGLAMPPNEGSMTDLEINRLLVWILTETRTQQ